MPVALTITGVHVVVAAVAAVVAFAAGLVLLRAGASDSRSAVVSFGAGVVGGIAGAFAAGVGTTVWQGAVDPDCYDECHRYVVLAYLVAMATVPIGAAVGGALLSRSIRSTIGVALAAHATMWFFAALIVGLLFLF